MQKTVRLTAALAMLTAGPALAQPACPLPYAAFEAAVPHVDLETCPQGAADRPAICRLTVNAGTLHLFVFAEEGEQCLISVKTLTPDDYALTVK